MSAREEAIFTEMDKLRLLNAELLEACAAAYEANKNEWLYQTGQFSRIANPPSNYPPQGSVHGGLVEANRLLRAAIEKARG